MENKKHWFFGSKLNTALLLVLIVLMLIALRWMYQNKASYSNIGVNTTLYDSLNAEKSKVFEDASTSNPKLDEVVGSGGTPLGKE